jgi:hypothetical protein
LKVIERDDDDENETIHMGDSERLLAVSFERLFPLAGSVRV